MNVADLQREAVSVLWHPEGEPFTVSAVVIPVDTGDGTVNRYYAQSPRGSWWRLSGVGPSGWRAPAVHIASGIKGIMLRAEGGAA